MGVTTTTPDATEAVTHSYELNVILDPNLNETQVQAEKDAVVGQVERYAGEIAGVDEWGNRRLAYPIRKQQEGYYLIYTLTLAGTAPKAIESGLRLRDNVMRALVTRIRPEERTRRAKEKREQDSALRD